MSLRPSLESSSGLRLLAIRLPYDRSGAFLALVASAVESAKTEIWQWASKTLLDRQRQLVSEGLSGACHTQKAIVRPACLWDLGLF
jgi:hypothetical protein